MHGDHTRIESFYQVRTNRLLYTTPQIYKPRHRLKTPIKASLQISPFYATTALKIYSKSSREFLQRNQQRKKIYSRERKFTAEKTTALKIYSKNSKEFLQRNQQRKKLHSREHYSIENLQQNQQRISTAKPAKKENLQQRRLRH